jgi:DNA repair protein RecN (Recombination protein N)
MLRRLFIRDFVIVDRLELDFAAGFGALTGETGAGKSILVDALSLALGERAEVGVVRANCERAEVSAEFSVELASPLQAWLSEHDFVADDGVCLLRRIVDVNGRSRAYINGNPATLVQLKDAADLLADIHGQHAHHSLLRPEAQRTLLDTHGGLTTLAKEVADRYRDWHRLAEARRYAERDAVATSRERELVEWQVKELRGLGFDLTAWRETDVEHHRLAHAANLIDGVAASLALLQDGDVSVIDLLERGTVRLGDLTSIDEGLKEPFDLVNGALIQVQEAAHQLARYRDRLELDPARLAEMEQRIDAVVTLARKQRVAPEELPRRLNELETRLGELSLYADPIALGEREAVARATYREIATRLSKERIGTAAALSAAITEAMQSLAIAGGSLEIALEPIEEGAAYGLENVEFRVSANAGQPLRSLAKVASGGELSRIGLAIQVIASRAGQAPTLIFDEVDVGIGGRVAEIVGRMLRELGRERQVLCVTHLPQVAAQADWQWVVGKREEKGTTTSRVEVLDGVGRIEEIARMLGGERITETTRKHAQEMLGVGTSGGVAAGRR